MILLFVLKENENTKLVLKCCILAGTFSRKRTDLNNMLTIAPQKSCPCKPAYSNTALFFTAVVGLLYPCIDSRLGEPHKFKREWASVMRCVAVFVGINHASAVSSGGRAGPRAFP